ncbi:sugar phosphate isomerase/epimerase family protein [Fictibacillus fluitans]|uniref:Sugar phosphate isomerase/epimerase n=1 Tax=Fictibacillus fluitans TaxID=3058422 RepID=A0ABT8HYZ0_9BACL|nr:sugar phosphate isomerase/epimerase [Fictibacillus sp. NE201]MDN4525968.1 sugar phosphate isomerase/epimerase [Fictibacillus sp. NE201]
MEEISLQMYSLREQCEGNFTATLEEVANAGYKAIELAGTYGMGAVELKQHLDRLGLKVSGAHIGLDVLKHEIGPTMEYQQILGNKLLICPHGNTNTNEEVEELVKDLTEINQRCQQNGFNFAYHNHANEFNMVNGEYALTKIMNETPFSLKFELDTYWAYVAGVDIAAYLDVLQDRCTAIHLKDLDEEGNDVEVGTGQVPFSEVLAKAKELRITNLVIEQEKFQIDPVESISQSYANISKLIEMQNA